MKYLKGQGAPIVTGGRSITMGGDVLSYGGTIWQAAW